MKIARLLLTGYLVCAPFVAQANPFQWALEFPKADFSKTTIAFSEIRATGTPRDSIPAIMSPKFKTAKSISGLGALEPILRLEVAGEVRGYPLRILLWHELVNDSIQGVPVLVSYCALCSSGIVFDRRLAGKTLAFGNTGRLRHYDLLMYDTMSESWWQQYTGEAVIGAHAGKRLKPLASRIQSFETFRLTDPGAQVLIPDDVTAFPYGKTPYVRMDSRSDKSEAFPYAIPPGVTPLERVVVVGDNGWPLERLRREKRITFGGWLLTWSPGMNSIHDTDWIPFGRDIGNVRVQQNTPDGWTEAVHDTTFAFAFGAFRPKAVWHLE